MDFLMLFEEDGMDSDVLLMVLFRKKSAPCVKRVEFNDFSRIAHLNFSGMKRKFASLGLKGTGTFYFQSMPLHQQNKTDPLP